MPGLSKLRLSIRWKLLLPFILLILLVMGVLLPTLNQLISDRVEAAADVRLTDTANSVAALMERSEEQARLSANFVANLPELITADSDEEVIADVLTRQRESLGLQEISYYTIDFERGDTPLVYEGPISNRRFQVSESTSQLREVLILEAILNGVPASDIAIAPQGSQIIGVAPVPAFSADMGEQMAPTQGVILAAVYIDDAYVESISTILAADVAIVSENAIVVSTISRGTGYETLLEEGFGANDRMISASSLDAPAGEEATAQRLLAAPLVIDGLQRGTVLVAQSISEFVVMQRNIQNAVIALGIGLTIASLIFGIGTLLNFAQPIKRLADAANAVSRGDLRTRVEPHTFVRDEVSELAENFNDMTERLQALYTDLEGQVQGRTRELLDERNKLDRALEDLAVARDQALEANRAKSSFLANMSHELRTPLNSILGYTELLVQGLYGELNDRQLDRMEKVMRNGKHLLELINDILDLSKIEAGRMDLNVEAVKLRTIVEECAGATAPLARKKGLQLTYDIPEDFPDIMADRSRTFQVLMNLVSNAIKFTQEGRVAIYSQIVRSADDIPDAKVDLSKLEGPWALVAVDDTGIGISPNDQASIFDEFKQVDDAPTREFEGTGLGLAISRRLVHMMEGEIWLESAPQEGTTFFILLPLATDDVPAV